jgi:hypothetical protein
MSHLLLAALEKQWAPDTVGLPATDDEYFFVQLLTFICRSGSNMIAGVLPAEGGSR